MAYSSDNASAGKFDLPEDFFGGPGDALTSGRSDEAAVSKPYTYDYGLNINKKGKPGGGQSGRVYGANRSPSPSPAPSGYGGGQYGSGGSVPSSAGGLQRLRQEAQGVGQHQHQAGGGSGQRYGA